MHKLFLVTFCVTVYGSAAMAQNKVNTKWHCPKVPENNLDVGV
jgi:hypothetical protein